MKYYINRDVSWMDFNSRILREGMRPDIPLMERLGFLGIYSNNLDEFFRVRVATLNHLTQLSKAYYKEREEARQALEQINRANKQQNADFEQAVSRLFGELDRQHIHLINEQQLTPDQQSYVRQLFDSELNGVIHPQWLDCAKNLEENADDNGYLAIRLEHTDEKSGKKHCDYAVIQLPQTPRGRFIRLPDKDGECYIMYLDDVIRFCLPQLFTGTDFTDFSAYTFKFTKDAEMELENDQRIGTLQKISKGVKSRKKGLPIRFVYDARMPKDLLKKLTERINLHKADTVIPSSRYHNRKDLMKFPDCGRQNLKYPAWPSIVKKELSQGSILEAIRLRDRFLHVPYHSFDSFIRVLSEAAVNRDVTAIKATIYRAARNSQVINALICAARNGKKVTVIIELMARFDEASNIDWSKKMQDAGIHVVFGVEGLKVHAKLIHIASRKGDIACISTGNFHEGNARAYTDYILMTAARAITRDVERVFQFIQRPYLPVKFHELLVSPNEMKLKLKTLIQREIRNASKGIPARIDAKLNHLTDPDLVDLLYRASAAGVEIRLALRGNCSLMAGLPGVSEHIRIRGIIDRYLEHSRILIFANGGQPLYFIGSADWMPRNLDSRIEVMTPVYDPEIQKDLEQTVRFALEDNTHGHAVNSREEPPQSGQPEPFRSQEALYHYYRSKEEE